MDDEIKIKLDEILKHMDAKNPGSVNFPMFAKFAQKPMLRNKETAQVLSVSVRTMANLRKFDGLDHFIIRTRPHHLWSHILAYIESKL